MDADILKQIMVKHFSNKGFAVHTEIAVNKWAKFRADVMAISMRNQIVIVETKSSVADFKNDHKWHEYLKYCHQFYFAMSDSTYAKVSHLIPNDVGTFVVNDAMPLYLTKGGSQQTDAGKFAYHLEGRSKKREVAPAIVLDVTTRMAFRGSSVQKYDLKSKTVGTQVVAKAAVTALHAAGKQSLSSAVKIVAEAVQPFV